MDAFWSVVVGAAAQASIERGALIDIADVLPENFDLTLSSTDGATAFPA